MSLENLYFKEQMKNLYQQKETLIQQQLSELINRGLLIVEETEPVLVGKHDFDSDNYIIKVEQKIRLVLKDQEYIERLEKENNDLKRKLENLNSIINDEDGL